MNNTLEQVKPADHRLTLDNRQSLTVTGVADVESFDDASVILHTPQAVLIVRGEQLHLRSLEGGQVFVDGRIDALVYQNAHAPSGGGLWSRLFG